MLLAVSSCGPPELEVVGGSVPRSGGVELKLLGDFGGHGAVIVLIDGVPAHGAVVESPHLLRVRVPPLPRAGTVDVELSFADGARMELNEALVVRAPDVDVSP
ncbi:hypothetical protein ENSA5_11650 [Enhygromyxa salina]|uniref:IPT/TIG domain-containing protein n=1 Tax=Enhygromyxa salina TaxID=215803 RepID=A0A2S9YG60_9BACT|nr:hypothetical protein ENSA5_11650 [Enhygromyxa salina]